MNDENDDSTKGNIVASLRGSLLDSSLIRQTNNMQYNAKIIVCGDYIHLYLYDYMKTKKDKNLCPIGQEKKKIIIDDKSNIYKPKYNEIREDNALRSKLSLERLIKANAKIFKTFITLTFADNISSIEEANNCFNIWRTRAKRLYPTLEYICVPEYQKRGAVHYHLVTNIPINSDLIALQEGKANQYDVKYWFYGFSSVFEIKDINVVGYMSKYMTKDINNRLFGRKRYFYSKGLNIPKQTFFDTEDEKVTKYVREILLNKRLNYHNIYLDKFTEQKIEFFELIPNNL
jgi:hypothetical protein